MPHNPQEIVANAVAAVDDLVQNDGWNPTAALAKIAEEHKLTPGYTRLAGQTWNVGAQRVQQEKAASIDDLLESFTLADAEKVVDTVWGKGVSEKAASAVDDVYSQDASWVRKLYKTEHKYTVKEALHGCTPTRPAAAKPAKPPIAPALEKPPIRLPAKAAIAAVDQNKRIVAEAKAAHLRAQDEALHAISDVVRHFRYREDRNEYLPSVEKTAMRHWGAEQVGTLFRYLNASFPVNKFAKAARTIPMAVDTTQAPWSLIEAALEKASEAAEAHKDWTTVRDVKERENDRIMAPLGGLPQRSAARNAEVSEKIEAEEKAANVLGSMIGSTVGTRTLREIAGEKKDKAVEDQYMKLTAPSHEAQLRQIRAEALLHNLMANDEVIGSYDPDTVLSHFNEISQLVPAAALQPAIARSALRERLASNVGTFEAGQLADIQKKLSPSPAPDADSIFSAKQ